MEIEHKSKLKDHDLRLSPFDQIMDTWKPLTYESIVVIFVWTSETIY